MHIFRTHYQLQKSKSPSTSDHIAYKLEVVGKFTYLGSTITSKLSPDKEMDIRIDREATTSRLGTRVWNNPYSLSRPRCQSWTFVFLLHFYTEANAGQHILLKNVYWISSTCANWGSCLGYLGQAGHQTQLCYLH